MGRINPRDAGRRPMDPQTLIMTILLGVVVTAAFTVQLSLWAAVKLGAAEMDLSINPFETLLYLATGRLPWPPVATVVAIGTWIAVLAIFIAVRRLFPKKTRPSIDHAQKYLASAQDIDSMSRQAVTAKALRFMDPKIAKSHPGLRIGKIPGSNKGLYSDWEETYLIIFGPRKGKTTSQVIPAIIDAPGPVMTTSNKFDIIDETIGVTELRGKVWVFDPQDLSLEAGLSGRVPFDMYFDPLDMVRDDPKKMDSNAIALANIFLAASRSGKDTGDPYFINTGRDVLGFFFLAAALDNRPITDVFKWVNNIKNRDALDILQRYPEWKSHADALRASYNTTEKTRSGFFSQAQQMARILGFHSSVKWITPSPGRVKFDALDFIKSKDTLYLLSQEEDGEALAGALTSALVATVLKKAMRYANSLPTRRLPVPLVAALDEAANTVRWPGLPAMYSHFGSRGIILMTILQSFFQGENAWGKEGMATIWDSASHSLIGAGVRSSQFLSDSQKLIGTYEVWDQSVSRNKDGSSVSSSKKEKDILTAADISSMPAGRALLLSSGRRPMIVQLEPWWERKWPQAIKKLLGAPKIDPHFYDNDDAGKVRHCE